MQNVLDDSPSQGPDMYYALVGFPVSVTQVRSLFSNGFPLDAVVCLDTTPTESKELVCY